ncbi:DUF6441 family protein [uncultured Cohaesibacter sp.]|uniref:DUF6441 family protein n=1 Tax=uncultured Cohaesibacter sp. TaxID=1002546 RepID=UPI0029C77051|nr:DUF6441 family protein [uncultured Cohaesibacter sp.]
MSYELFKVAVEHDYEAYLNAVPGRLSKAIRRGMEGASGDVKRSFRDQVSSVFSQRLANTIRDVIFPKRGVKTLEPSAMIYTKAPHIIGAFAEGATIVPKVQWSGARLCIPTKDVPRSRIKRRQPMSVEEFTDTFGGESLSPIPGDSTGNVLYLVAKQGFRHTRSRKPSKRVKRARRIGKNSKAKSEPILMYVAVKQVRLEKRIDFAAVEREAIRTLPNVIATEIAKELG